MWNVEKYDEENGPIKEKNWNNLIVGLNNYHSIIYVTFSCFVSFLGEPKVHNDSFVLLLPNYGCLHLPKVKSTKMYETYIYKDVIYNIQSYYSLQYIQRVYEIAYIRDVLFIYVP